MRYAAAIFWVATLIAWPTSGWSESVTLVASKDNSIFHNNVDYSNGGGAGVFVGTTNDTQNNSLRRGLLEFDIENALPAGATITEVNSRCTSGKRPLASGVRTIDLHRLTADWGEGTAGNTTTSISGTGTGFPASEGDATWNQRFYQQTDWTAPARKATTFQRSVRAPTSERARHALRMAVDADARQ